MATDTLHIQDLVAEEKEPELLGQVGCRKTAPAPPWPPVALSDEREIPFQPSDRQMKGSV